MTLDNSAWRRGSNLFCSARPALQGFPMCVGKGRNDPQRGGICGTTCVVPPHHLDCVCVCVGVCVVVFSLFLSWAGNAILGLLRSGLLPLPSPFLVMMITRGGEGGLAGHRWLAGSLVWTIQTHTRWARRRRTATTTNNKTTSRDRLMKKESLQCILRGWRPLIEASPPPLSRGRSSLLLPCPRPHPGLTRC